MQYAYTSESGSRLISDHGSDALNSQSDEKQFKPRYYNSIKIEDFVYESWPPLLRYGGGASYEYYDSPITSIVCQGGICIYSYEAGNKSETIGQHGASTLSFLAARRISSFQTNIGSRTEIFKFIGASESRGYIYEPGITEDYNELDYGLITANHTATIDNGLVSHTDAVTITSHGNILDGYRTRFGFKKTIGEAQAKATNAWVGSGRILSWGRQTSPAIYGYIVDGKVKGLSGIADASFTTNRLGGGLTPLGGTAIIGITVHVHGDGNLRKFGGSAESATWNPDEKQMLFSFTGGITSEKHIESYLGSGRIKNLAKVEAEKGTFDYVGSGEFKLRPRKPSTHRLSHLANFTLESSRPYWHVLGDPNGHWGNTQQLGAVQLKELTEWSHEKHTDNYNQSSIVEYVERDWGFVQTECSNIGTISTSGDVSGSVSECTIKIDQGVTARVTSGQNYQVALGSNSATNFIDYGLVSEGHSPSEDWGWILDWGTKSPYGLFRFDQSAEASIQFIPNWVGRGGLRIFGASEIPLDVSVYGAGTLFSMGGGAESSSTSEQRGGLTSLSGSAIVGITAITTGSGSLKKFGGSAESATFNPLERQMLFSFTGGITSEKHTESYVGSGRLRNFAKLEAERGTFDYVGSGGFKFQPENAIEKNTDCYNQSSIVDFARADYGTVVDQNPTTTIDYGNVADSANATIDYGWILGERSDLRTPYGLFKIQSTTDVVVKKQFSYDGIESVIKLSGVARVPLEASAHGKGHIFVTGGAVESSVVSTIGSGIGRLSGNAVIGVGLKYIGSGSLRKLGGLAESITFNPEEKQMLFSFTGGLTSEKHVESYVGSGFLRNFASVETRATFDYVGSGGIKLRPRKPVQYELEELSNFTLDNYALQYDFIDLGDIDFYNEANTNLGSVKLKWLTLEQSHEKHTEAYNNSACEDAVDLDYGNLVNQNLTNCVATSGVINTNTTATSGCIKVATGTTLAIAPSNTYTIPNQLTTPSVTEDYGLVSESNAPEHRDYGWILGTLSKKCPYGYSDIIGAAKTHFVEKIITTGYSVSGKAGVNIFGSADTFWTPPYHGRGLGRIIGFGHESFTPATAIGEGILFSMGGGAESTSVLGYGGGLFKIGSQGYTLFSLLHPGSGLIRVTGTGTESFTPTTYVGSGSLKKFSGAAESATFNPLERQMLFSFTGVGTETFTANPPEEGTQVRISGDAFPVFFVPKYPGSGLIKISGEGDTDRTRSFVGSGSLKKFSGAAESLTFNPEEKQLLFSFTGTGTEKVTFNPPEEGTNIRLRGEAVLRATISQVGDLRIPVFGDAFARATLRHIGSGSLKKFSGAAESITFNPEEKRLLFSFAGTGSERTFVVPPEGDGVLFTFGGSTTTSATSYQSTGLFRVDGFTDFTRSRDFIGSGSLKKFSGAAESITFNPDEKQMLFSFTGAGSERTFVVPPEGDGRIAIYPEAADYRFTPNWNSVGGIRLEIEAAYRFAPVWIGSGSLKKFNGAAESLTVNPLEKQLLFSFVGERIAEKRTSREISKGGTLRLDGTPRVVWVPNNIGSGTIFVSGTAKTHYVPHITGSGSLYNFSGAAESKSVDITTLPALFRVYGDGGISRTRPYIGSGSLKKFQGAAESITINPDEKQMLFSFLGQGTTTRTRSESGQGTVKTLGESTVRFSPVYFGSGTARVSGEAIVTRARDFVGFGSLRKLSGAAESLTFNPEEKQMLFSFLGVGAESRTSRELSQSGVLAVRGTSGDPLLTFAEQPRVEIDITGDSYDLRAHAYQGSGRISNVNNADDAYVRAPYKGSGRIALSGIALVQVQLFQPPHTQVWII